MSDVWLYPNCPAIRFAAKFWADFLRNDEAGNAGDLKIDAMQAFGRSKMERPSPERIDRFEALLVAQSNDDAVASGYARREPTRYEIVNMPEALLT